MFSLLAFSIIGISRTIPWFRNNLAVESAPLSICKDWDAARILPFAAFMGASLLLSTFFLTPDLWYVVKVVTMAATLAIFLPLYRRLSWNLDWLAVGAGLAIGVLWIGLGSGHSAADSPIHSALAGLPPIALAAWIVLRICGTVFLVPMVEELFFRGYVLERLDQGGLKMRLLALAVSTGLFAALHERWALAGLAGLVYGLLYLRRRQVTDAVSSHAVSNAFIAAVALASNDWSLI
jgi:exosortase E/protease (VPEID-CTERM system)